MKARKNVVFERLGDIFSHTENKMAPGAPQLPPLEDNELSTLTTHQGITGLGHLLGAPSS